MSRGILSPVRDTRRINAGNQEVQARAEAWIDKRVRTLMDGYGQSYEEAYSKARDAFCRNFGHWADMVVLPQAHVYKRADNPICRRLPPIPAEVKLAWLKGKSK